jgi:hypothetical protein
LRLAEVRANQAARRQVRVIDQVELDELRAVKFLAHRLWGELGLVEFDADPVTQRRIGPLQIGYYLDPPNRRAPGNRRRTRMMFQGASHRELVDQVRAYKSKGGKGVA